MHHHYRHPFLLAGIIGGATMAGASGMLGRFFWRLGVFLAICWAALLLFILIASPGEARPGGYLNGVLALVVGDLVILGLAAGLAWVCGGAPWARS